MGIDPKVDHNQARQDRLGRTTSRVAPQVSGTFRQPGRTLQAKGHPIGHNQGTQRRDHLFRTRLSGLTVSPNLHRSTENLCDLHTWPDLAARASSKVARTQPLDPACRPARPVTPAPETNDLGVHDVQLDRCGSDPQLSDGYVRFGRVF